MSSATQVNMRHWLVRTQCGAAVSAVAVAVVAAAVGLTVQGVTAGMDALLGALLVVLFFALGALVEVASLKWLESIGILVLLSGYVFRIGLLGATAGLMMSASWLAAPAWFAAGIVAATIAWITGLVVAHVTGRWPIYDLAVAK